MTETFHPVTQVYDGLFNSSQGKQISLHRPTPDMIDLRDICIGLGNVCRFGGQIPGGQFYSVAQHSVMVALLAPIHLRMEALLHDATEAYLGDVIKPLKVILGAAYEDIEDRFEKAIFDRFTLDVSALPQIKPLDTMVLEWEFEWLFKGGYPAPGFITYLIRQEYPELLDKARWNHVWREDSAKKFLLVYDAINQHLNKPR